MTPDEEILQLLRDWAPEIVRLLDQAGYFDLPRDSTKREMIAQIGLNPGGRVYRQVLQASGAKNQAISRIVLDEYSLREFNAAGVWTSTRDAVYCTAVMAVGDKIRLNGTDYTILKVEDNPGLDGSSEFYTYLVA
jgi:hypothetical protein